MGRPKSVGSKTAASQLSNDKQMRISLQNGSMSVKRVHADENVEPLQLPEEPNNNEAHQHNEDGDVEILHEEDGTEIRIISADLPSNNTPDATQAAAEKHVSKKTKVADSTFDNWSKEFVGVERGCNPEGIQVLWCSTCLRATEIGFKPSNGRISPWACRDEGCKTFLRDALKDHWGSGFHVQAADYVMKNDKPAKPITSYIRGMQGADTEALINGLKTVAFIASNNLPLAKFEPVTKDLGKNLWGVKELQEHYMNWRFATQAAEAISDYLTEQLKKDLALSPCLSLEFDELTDNSTASLLIVYVGYIKDGSPRKSFGSCVEMESTKGEAISFAVLGVCEHLGIDIGSVTSISTDGAAAMAGNKNGAQAWIKKQNPYTLHTHCVAHISALASADVYTDSVLRELDDLLSMVFAVFRNSPKMMAQFKDVQEQLDLKPLRMLQFHGVRWLSRYEVLQRLWDRLVPLLQCLETDDRKSSRSENVMKDLLEFGTMAGLRFTMVIIEMLAKFNKFLQNRRLHPVDVMEQLDITIDQIESAFIDHGVTSPSVVKWLNEELEHNADGDYVMWPKILKADDAVPEDEETEQMEYSVPGSKKAKEQWPVCKKELFEIEKSLQLNFMTETAKKIVIALRDRFANVRPFFEACKLLHPREWPRSGEELSNWGREGVSKEWMDTIGKQYGVAKKVKISEAYFTFTPPIDWEVLEKEFPAFMKRAGTSFRREKPHETYELLLNNGLMWSNYPNCNKLVSVIATLATSSVECERGVSMVNAIKTDETNRLGIGALNHRARIRSSYLEYGGELQMYGALDWTNIYNKWRKKDGNIRGRTYAPPVQEHSEELLQQHSAPEKSASTELDPQRKVKVVYRHADAAVDENAAGGSRNLERQLTMEGALIAEAIMKGMEAHSDRTTRSAANGGAAQITALTKAVEGLQKQMAWMQNQQCLHPYWAAMQLQIQAAATINAQRPQQLPVQNRTLS